MMATLMPCPLEPCPQVLAALTESSNTALAVPLFSPRRPEEQGGHHDPGDDARRDGTLPGAGKCQCIHWADPFLTARSSTTLQADRLAISRIDGPVESFSRAGPGSA